MNQRMLARSAIVLLTAALVLAPAVASARRISFGKLFKMSESQELKIAQEMQAEFAKDPGFVTEGESFDLVQRLGTRLVERNNLDEYEYQFFLLKDEEVNAFATPAGYIYVTVGLLDYMAYDESMLAGVIAHELGHAKDRHVAKGYEKLLAGTAGLTVLGLLLGQENEDITNVLFAGGQFVFLKYNRDQEEWADRAGVELNYAAGYDAYGLARSLECLEALYGSGGKIAEYMSDHPDTGGRIERTLGIARETSGRPHGYARIPCPPQGHPLYEKYQGRCGDNSALASGEQLQGGIGTAESYSR